VLLERWPHFGPIQVRLIDRKSSGKITLIVTGRGAGGIAGAAGRPLGSPFEMEVSFIRFPE
jgi:hypothetical protein